MEAATADQRLTTLFDQHYDEVLAYCARRIGRNEADEAAAEVFAIAWRKIDDLDWNTTRAWLYGIARRVLANRWRGIYRRGRLDRRLRSLADSHSESPEVVVMRRIEDQHVSDALGRLSPIDQEVLRLAAWEDLSASEIAIVLGIATSAAEKRRQRALQRLTRLLESDNHSKSPPRAAEGGGG